MLLTMTIIQFSGFWVSIQALQIGRIKPHGRPSKRGRPPVPTRRASELSEMHSRRAASRESTSRFCGVVVMLNHMDSPLLGDGTGIQQNGGLISDGQIKQPFCGKMTARQLSDHVPRRLRTTSLAKSCGSNGTT